MSRGAKCFWALVFAQAVFLVAWAGYHERVRQNGLVLLLRAQPVDPQDLLRGDYMTLRYDIGDVAVPRPLAAGEEFWVLLTRGERYYTAAAASRTPPTPQPGQVLVRATVAPSRWSGDNATGVAYGIERYFVPEGKGSPRFKRIEVEVAVSESHRLYIKRVLLDGKPYP